jgi:hypothetical protein
MADDQNAEIIMLKICNLGYYVWILRWSGFSYSTGLKSHNYDCISAQIKLNSVRYVSNMCTVRLQLYLSCNL